MPAVRRISRTKVAHEITLALERDSRRPKNEVKLKTKAEAEKVAAYWKTVAWPTSIGRPPAKMPMHGYETGSYIESIHVEQRRDTRFDRKGRFLAEFIVISRHPNANFIEFGTGIDKPGSRSPWGPFTPTPEFAPAMRTALFFRGTAP